MSGLWFVKFCGFCFYEWMRFWSPHWSTHKHCFCCYQSRCHLLCGNLKKAVRVRSCQPSNQMISLLSLFFYFSVSISSLDAIFKNIQKKTGRSKPIHCATFQRITCVWTTLFTHQPMYTLVLMENRGQWEQWTLIKIFFFINKCIRYVSIHSILPHMGLKLCAVWYKLYQWLCACLLCIWSPPWRAVSLGLFIYIFINHRSQRDGSIEDSFKCKLTLRCLHTTHTSWQSPTALLQYTSLSSSSLPPTHTHTQTRNPLVRLSPRETRLQTVNPLINTSIN